MTKVHYLASLLSGDPQCVSALKFALRGRSLEFDLVLAYAQELSDKAREGDTDAIDAFDDDLTPDELIGRVTTDQIIDRIGDQGVTGRAIDVENDDHYEGDGEELENADEVRSQEG